MNCSALAWRQLNRDWHRPHGRRSYVDRLVTPIVAPRLFDNFELSIVIGNARGSNGLLDVLSEALLLQLRDAVVAKGVVAASTKGGVCHERTAALTDLFEVAACAKAPKLINATLAGERQLFGFSPDTAEVAIADVSNVIRPGGQRWTRLDRPIRLDAERVSTSAATRVVAGFATNK